MLTIHDFAKATFEPWPGSAQLAENVTWIDAHSPTPDEAAFLKRALGVTLPSLEDMLEIEQSSRFYRLGEAICVTVPLPKRDPEGLGVQHPLALILTPKALVTVRYEGFRPCDPDYLEMLGVDRGEPGPFSATVGVLSAILDHVSNDLERLTAQLEGYSRTIFAKTEKGARTGLRGNVLRGVIADIGRQRQFHSLVEETLLALSRAIPYIDGQLGARISPNNHGQLVALLKDVDSLSAHETRLSDKSQFLLDATLGLINVEQNEIFKVLTIASVIGIPPTLIASMYGMNFKYMPELEWEYAYPFAVGLIALSGIVPMLWFRWRRWW